MVVFPPCKHLLFIYIAMVFRLNMIRGKLHRLSVSQAVHCDFSREAKFAHFAFRVNDPAALSFFVRSFARRFECFAQVFVVLRTHIYNANTVRLVLLSRGCSLATTTCVKLSVGPITHVESYGQVHKSWRTGSCLPFGNCKCYYLYFVKC